MVHIRIPLVNTDTFVAGADCVDGQGDGRVREYGVEDMAAPRISGEEQDYIGSDGAGEQLPGKSPEICGDAFSKSMTLYTTMILSHWRRWPWDAFPVCTWWHIGRLPEST